eukprot:6858387-Pyramimonas_sp.AAC.1
MVSSPLQKKIIRDLWDLHAQRASWGNANDGKVALGHLEETTGSGYYTTVRKKEESKKVTRCKKGDVGPLRAGQVSLPSPGTTPRRAQDFAACADIYIDSLE